MRKSIAAAVILASAAAVGCSRLHAESGGPKVSRNYQVGSFDKVEVDGPYEVDVHTGTGPSVSASGSQDVLDHTVVEVRGDRLVIRPQRTGGLFGGWSSHGEARFTVSVPRLSEAALAGSGDLSIDRVQGASFQGNVAGSGDLSVAALDVQRLKLGIGGSGDLKAGSGRAQSAEYSIGGSGDLDAGAVATQQLKVSVAGSGGVKAHSSGTATVSMAGSGDVEIAGGAKCQVSKMGSGDVRCS